MKRPWMPLYIADYLADTTHLGALESGAYLHLIMDYWQNGGLPNDEQKLARISKLTEKEWKKLKPTLQEFFSDRWRHKRIEDELREARKISENNSGKASAAAKRRWSKHAPSNAPSMPQAMPGRCPDDAPAYAPECTLHTPHKDSIQEDKSISSDEGVW